MTISAEQTPSGGGARPTAREALIVAAERLVRERGARSLTTREIAREAGFSDSTLYVHFADKAHLLATLCERWLPDLHGVLGSLVDRVGAATVEENLRELATVAIRVYRDMVPSTFALAGDPELLQYHRAAMRDSGRGPRRGMEAIGAYIAAEQRLGRVRADADAMLTASMLLGSCWSRAALAHYFGEDQIAVDDGTYARGVAAAVMRGLELGG
jgi:AcrR family transcriptional regulator